MNPGGSPDGSPDDFRWDNISGSHGKRGLLRCPKIFSILNLEQKLLDELNEAHQEVQKLG